jgi:hypothetical protein
MRGRYVASNEYAKGTCQRIDLVVLSPIGKSRKLFQENSVPGRSAQNQAFVVSLGRYTARSEFLGSGLTTRDYPEAGKCVCQAGNLVDARLPGIAWQSDGDVKTILPSNVQYVSV